MLYVIGIILLLMSGAFVGGSALVPIVMASTGIALMMMGRRPTNEKRTRI